MSITKRCLMVGRMSAAVWTAVGLSWVCVFASGADSNRHRRQDTTPPIVSATVPANAAVDVPVNGKIAVTFSEAMDPDTMTASSFILAGVEVEDEKGHGKGKGKGKGKNKDEVTVQGCVPFTLYFLH